MIKIIDTYYIDCIDNFILKSLMIMIDTFNLENL